MKKFLTKMNNKRKKLLFGKKVLLMHAPFKDYSDGLWKKSECIIPPLGLLYLASSLKKDYSVEFLDMNAETLKKEEFGKLIAANDFFLIGCYTESLKNVEKIIEDTKEEYYDSLKRSSIDWHEGNIICNHGGNIFY